MNRFLTIGAVALLFSTPAFAQDDEARFNKAQADRLHRFAKSAFDKGFPRQARLIWLQLIKLYDQQHEPAHKALGHLKVGKAWNPDPNFDYPIHDSGSGADGKALFKKYESMKKALAGAHRGQAQRWQKAGRKDKSMYHFRMVLRWVKNDKKAQEALAHKSVGDVTGTDLEQTLYDRSKMMEKAVVVQSKIDYPVEEVKDSTQAFLEKAQVKYVTVKSEHFILRGDNELPVMKEALVWAERALRVMAVAFPKDGEFNPNVQTWLRDWAYFVDSDSYKQILKANAGLVGDLEWKLEHTSTSALVSEAGALRIGATGSRQVLFDAVVRNVAQSYSGLSSPGLAEGIGHTFVGMIFNNNRLFAVDLKKQQGTTASEEDREYTSPNFDIWKDLALEQAWKMTGSVKPSTLPLITAATFTNEQRIKAWSFCDYMMRREPKLLTALDRLRDKKNPWDIATEFAKSQKATLPQLDKEWEDFWTGSSPVMKAIKNNTPPLAAVSKDAIKWLKAFNTVRKEMRATPVSWSANYSTRCHDHARYLKKNKKIRGAGKVQEQDPDLEGGSHLGNMFAQMALVSTNASSSKAKKLFRSWIHIPGYRHALRINQLRSIGIYSDGKILVMNVVGGLGRVTKGTADHGPYPFGEEGVPREVVVKDLGPELQALLEQNGHGKLKVVGYPLTMHFGAGLPGNRASFNCVVSAKGEQLPGLIMLDSGKNRHTSAPGMATFYPLKPLPKGTKIDVKWSWESRGERRVLPSHFTTM